MARVDPFQLPVPKGVDTELQAYFRSLDRFLKDLWERTGGGDDLVEKADMMSAQVLRSHAHNTDDIEGFHFGSGAPQAATGSNGDYYFRADGGALTRIYHKGAGVWTGVL